MDKPNVMVYRYSHILSWLLERYIDEFGSEELSNGYVSINFTNSDTTIVKHLYRFAEQFFESNTHGILNTIVVRSGDLCNHFIRCNDKLFTVRQLNRIDDIEYMCWEKLSNIVCKNGKKLICFSSSTQTESQLCEILSDCLINCHYSPHNKHDLFVDVADSIYRLGKSRYISKLIRNEVMGKYRYITECI